MIVHERTVSFHNTHNESILTDRKTLFSEDITSILKSIETNLMHTSERIDFHERQICQLQTQQSIRYPSFYLIHFLLLIFVALFLKYLFRSS